MCLSRACKRHVTNLCPLSPTIHWTCHKRAASHQQLLCTTFSQTHSHAPVTGGRDTAVHLKECGAEEAADEKRCSCDTTDELSVTFMLCGVERTSCITPVYTSSVAQDPLHQVSANMPWKSMHEMFGGLTFHITDLRLGPIS